VPFANLPPSVYAIIKRLENRLQKLETAKRFTAPVVTADPPVPLKGDLWLNSSTNVLKYLDSTGATITVGTGSGGATGPAGGDLTGTYPNPSLAATGTAGTYGSGSLVPVITTDSKGRVTSITTSAVSGTLGYIGNTQTTASAGSTISLAVPSVSTLSGNAVSVTAGATTNALGTGGTLNITGGAASTGTNATTGGSVNITGGASNNSSGVGGAVTINAGLGAGPGQNGDSTVNIGTSNTTRINLGGTNTASTLALGSSLSFDSSSGGVITSVNAPGAIAVSGVYFNLQGNSGLNAQGQIGYSTATNNDVFAGWQSNTGTGRIPTLHSVFSLANSTSSTNTTQSVFAAANDVLSSLQAAKLYRFKAQYYSSFTYSAGFSGAININFAFSQTPTAIKYSFKTYPQTAGTTITQQGASTVATATTIVPSQSASGTWITEIEGYFTTHATLVSTFTPQFICTASANSSAVIQAGSWFEVEKLGTATTTLVAGNWA
jgi:hypothetical protein